MASTTASRRSEDQLLADYRNQLRRGCSGGQARVAMHPKLWRPARCRNCGEVEDLHSASFALPSATGNGEHAVVPPGPDIEVPPPPPPPPPQAAPAPAPALSRLSGEQQSCSIYLKDPSCFRCVREMYERTRHEAPGGSDGDDTPLQYAARSGNLRTLYHLITLLMLRAHRAVKAVTTCNANGETALHTAVSVGNLEIVELLLWVYPPLAQMTCSGISPMFLAASLGRKDIAQALHDASCSPTPTAISYSGPNRQNALHAAVLLKDRGMTRMILRWNKDLAIEKDEKGRTPLHFAVTVPQRRRFFKRVCYCIRFRREGTGSVKQLLLNADSSMAYQKDNEGLCPIHVAAMTNQWSSIYTMLETCPGCMDLRDNQGRTILHVAVQNNAVGVVRFACRRPEFEPILNIQDKNGNTALHFAVDVQNIRVLCILLKNPAVSLNLRNREGETALDVANRSIRKGFFFAENPDKLIYRTLQRVGAHRGWILRGKLAAKPDRGRLASGRADGEERTLAEDLEKEESAKLADSTRTLGIGSVLITSVTFAAAIARVPGGSGAGSGSNQPSSWHFDTFMVANAMAFICAACATVGLMYSGMAMVTLPFRQLHFNISLTFASYSVTFLTAAFALGVYMVLAPVARAAAITVSALCPLVVIYGKSQSLCNRVLVSGALVARRGFRPWVMSTVCYTLLQMLFNFWPFAVIFAWAAYSRNRQHD